MNTKTRVCFLIGDLRGGGAERAVVELLKAFNPVGFSLTLVLHKAIGQYLDEIPENVRVVIMPKTPGILNIFKRTYKLAKFLNKEQPDIIVGSLTETNIYLLQAKPFVKKSIRFIITEQNNLSKNLKTLYTPFHRFYKKIQIEIAYSQADKIIAVSRGIKKDLITNYKIKEEKVIVIENPVNIGQVKARSTKAVSLPCGFDNKKKLIVTVGRLSPQKGYFDMLEAFHLVNQQLPSQLIILGEGTLRSQLETRIKELSLENSVCMPGFVDNPWAYVQKADLYLSTSHWEGFSLSYIEAMACGTPLALTDCDYGPREIIKHGENGLLLPVGQIQKIAHQVVTLLTDDHQRKQLGERGAESVTKFDSKEVACKYEALFTELSTKG